MVLITFILLFITLLVYTFISENKQKALLISLGLVVIYVVCTTSFFTTLVLWEHGSQVPAFATLLLILIIIILFVYILFSKKKKIAWLISLGVITAYHFVVFCNCGPNIWDIRVMKPMAKAISDYIVKHGIPKSLSEIPNLPYKLDGCKREEYYKTITGKSVPQNKAFKYIQTTDCKTTRNISVHFRILEYLKGNKYIEANSTDVSIDFVSPNRTHYEIEIDKGNKTDFSVYEPRVYKYPNYNNMLCLPIRQ